MAEEASSPPDITMDTLARIYVKIRDKIQALQTEIDGLKDKHNDLKMEMKDRLVAAGGKSLRTDHGTVTLTKKTWYFTNDWPSFEDFAVEHKALSLFERRIAQTNMATFLEENPGVVPQGLNSETKFDIRVTKPK